MPKLYLVHRRTIVRFLSFFSAGLILTTVLLHAASAADLVVGYDTPNNALSLTSGTNEYSSTFVGSQLGSFNNQLSVIGAGTLLTNSSSLTIGRYGSGNSLVVSSGATVINNGNGWLARTTNSSNNSVLVTDAGTTWRSALLDVGRSGPCNSLVISNGGSVICQWSYISQDATSSNNSVLVTGEGSIWTNSQSLYVGNLAGGNTLVVSNGGTVASVQSWMGVAANSSNNSVLVTGARSAWKTYSVYFVVGNDGPSNRLVVSNGGTVQVHGNAAGDIGENPTSSNNSVLVTGAGSIWANIGTEAYLGVRVGVQGSGNSLIISNRAVVACASGSIGYFTNSSNNLVLITDVGSIWTNSKTFSMGEGSGNKLVISNGGTLASSNSWISYGSNSLNNSVTVTGNGSTFRNSGKLTVANAGSGSLVVTDGGVITSEAGIVIAASNSSTGTLDIGSFGSNDSAGAINSPNINFGSGSGAINLNQTNSCTVESVISGNGTLNQLGSGTTVLTGKNTYTGNTVISNGTLHVATNAALRFVIGKSGINNLISGLGKLRAEGVFDIVLDRASTNTDDTWTIVGNGISAAYGQSFVVDGFNGSGGIWTKISNGVTYTFSQATGLLTVSGSTNNYMNWANYWKGFYPNFTNTSGMDNPDGDSFDNNQEFAFGGNPMVGTPALLTVATSGTNVLFNYLARRSPPGGVSYLVKSKTNLSTGTWTNLSVTVSNSIHTNGIVLPADYELKEFAIPALGNQFLEVEATIAP